MESGTMPQPSHLSPLRESGREEDATGARRRRLRLAPAGGVARLAAGCPLFRLRRRLHARSAREARDRSRIRRHARPGAIRRRRRRAVQAANREPASRPNQVSARSADYRFDRRVSETGTASVSGSNARNSAGIVSAGRSFAVSAICRTIRSCSACSDALASVGCISLLLHAVVSGFQESQFAQLPSAFAGGPRALQRRARSTRK